MANAPEVSAQRLRAAAASSRRLRSFKERKARYTFDRLLMPPHRVPTPDAIARLRERYDAGDPTAELARVLGITESTFWKWRKQWGWPMRHASPARMIAQTPKPKRKLSDVSPEPSDDPVATADDTDVAAALAALDEGADAPSNERIAAALRRALYAELAVLLAGSGSKRGSEARARALASIGRTLTLLGATKDIGPESDDADAPPVDVAELRRELARRLHLISEARNDP